MISHSTESAKCRCSTPDYTPLETIPPPPFRDLLKCLRVPESTPPSQNNPPPYQPNYMCDPPRIYPSLPKYTPLFNKFICATLPQSTPPSQSIPPLSANLYVPPSSQNISLLPFLQLYAIFQEYPSVTEYAPFSKNYM